MANVGDVQVCTAVDVDGVCTATAWMPQHYLVPPMSHEEAAPILAAIVGLWIISFAFRRARDAINAGGG